MAFEKSFCSSPWFHMRINNSGTYEYCRWMHKTSNTRINDTHNITNQSPLVYFQQTMAPIRQKLLDGQVLESCRDCHEMEKHNKVSGRQRQLLKAGIQEQYFEQGLASSPLRSAFDYSNNHEGLTERTVSDWQIDLGNYCNGACVFCHPESSSRLAVEFKQLGLIDALPTRSWCDDPALIDRFVTDLTNSNSLKYLHFIGGETVITPGFKTILSALVDKDMAKDVTIGFTTNLTVWSDDIIDLLIQFKQVNLGLSVETLTPVNDYVRYPSQQDQTQQLLDRWCCLGKQHKWLIQLRMTPTCLTVQDLTTVYDYAWVNGLSVESCNFLTRPEFLRIDVLPQKYRQQARDRLYHWIMNHPIDIQQQIINTRDPGLAHSQIRQDAESYLNYLDNALDESHRLPDLVKYLKQLEHNRKNSILDYLPEYEDLFRSAGY